jgi:hypothetical protein
MRCSWSSTRWPPPSGSRTCCTTCSTSRTARSPPSSSARRWPRANSRAAPAAGSGQRARRPSLTPAASGKSSPPSSRPHAAATSARCSPSSITASRSAPTRSRADGRIEGGPRRGSRGRCVRRAPPGRSASPHQRRPRSRMGSGRTTTCHFHLHDHMRNNHRHRTGRRPRTAPPPRPDDPRGDITPVTRRPGSPGRSPGRPGAGRYHRCDRQAELASCAGCGSWRLLLPGTARCATCSRTCAGLPCRGPAPGGRDGCSRRHRRAEPSRACRVCGKPKVNLAHRLCGNCWQQDPARLAGQTDRLAAWLGDPPAWPATSPRTLPPPMRGRDLADDQRSAASTPRPARRLHKRSGGRPACPAGTPPAPSRTSSPTRPATGSCPTGQPGS